MAEELAKAKAGEKLTEKQTSNALDQALDRLGSLQKATAKGKEMMQRGGTALLNSAEQHGTTLLASMLDGYTADKWTKVGGVPMKLVGGLLIEGIGVYQTMTGHDGSHAAAFGRGLAAVDIVRIGREAGAKLAKPDKPADGAQTPPAGTGTTPGATPTPPEKQEEHAGLRRINWSPPMATTPGPGPDHRAMMPRRPARWQPVGRPG